MSEERLFARLNSTSVLYLYSPSCAFMKVIRPMELVAARVYALSSRKSCPSLCPDRGYWCLAVVTISRGLLGKACLAILASNHRGM
jgi:hypothetical protein